MRFKFNSKLYCKEVIVSNKGGVYKKEILTYLDTQTTKIERRYQNLIFVYPLLVLLRPEFENSLVDDGLDPVDILVCVL